jgi:hypothetical protein
MKFSNIKLVGSAMDSHEEYEFLKLRENDDRNSEQQKRFEELRKIPGAIYGINPYGYEVQIK